MIRSINRPPALLALLLVAACWGEIASAADLTVLFMGDNGHHRPAVRFQELAPVLEKRGVKLQYTDRMEDLNPTTLAKYDGLVLYANIDKIEDDQARAVLDYVAGGKGFIPLHCATYCWRNNTEMVALMGGQFQRHGGRVFTTEIALPEHPVMKGYDSFTSWDETYVHHLHNELNRTVLEYRTEGEQADGSTREPWTWVRTHGKGRVFYTAWGHDARTFTQPGFHNLVERGIRWACGDDPGKAASFSVPGKFMTPKMTALRQDVTPFEFVDVGPKIPNYTPGPKWGEQEAPLNLMQKPLPGDESIKHFVTPIGMSVRPYADESSFRGIGDLTGKPIAMNWDERGRLWICETVDYPNELGGNRDRIRICEDTDGDHVADKFTVFAEGLSIPTAIVIVRGGAVVQNATETIYLKDVDGDDVSDQKTTLITNWMLGDTHGGVSNFRYGLDNWIWAMQGYNNSTPNVDGKPIQTFRMGFWRFKLSQSDPPRVTDLEFIRSTNNNTWGLGISEEGLIFGSTANRNPSVFMPIPNRYYERVRGWAPPGLGSIADDHLFDPITENVRQVDHHGGYTAGAGHALYTARAFPMQWWNKTAFVCGPTGHLVGTFALRRDGAGYTSTSPCNLLASDDQWSAPIMAEVGPDGAVWVLDWYNYIVQHNPTPHGFTKGKGNAYESDLRDKKHGRIYRVVPDGGGHSIHAYSDLADASNAELVQTLKHPSFPWRLQAQRLLVERGADDVLQPLLTLVADRSVDEIGLNPGAIHALQTLDGLGYIRLDPRLLASGSVRTGLQAALKHPSAGVRRNAIAVLPRDDHGLELLLANRTLLTDEDAQVQLQAVLTLADMPLSEPAGQLVADLVTDDADPVLIEALTSAAAAHSIPYLIALTSENQANSSAVQVQVARRVSEHVGRGKPDAKQLQAILVGLQHGAGQLLAGAVLDGLTRGIPNGFAFATTAGFDAALVAALGKSDAATKSKLIRLATKCGTKALDAHVSEIVQSLSSVIGDVDASDADRVAAATDLVGFRSEDAKITQQIIDQINAQTPPTLARQLLQSVRISQSAASGDAIAGAIPDFTPQMKSEAINALLSRPAWVKSLLAGIEDRAIDLDDLTLDQKQALRGFPDADLRARAEKLLAMGGGLPNADRQEVLNSLMHLTKREGNVDAGREMFKKHCSACHMHGEIGKTLGPNLTGMAVHPKAELLTHIVDPSRSVEGNFRMYTVLTSDGRVMSGMLAGESRTSISLIDSQAKEISIQREDIDQLQASRKSVMPEGFEKQMKEEEFSDLLEFLTNKGEFVPVPLDRYATAVSTKALFSSSGNDNSADRMIFSDWKPKTFKQIPFWLTDPLGKSKPNIILLNGPNGTLPPKMPKSVSLPCNTAAKAIHLLSGVGGWNFPFDNKKTVSMIVRLHYTDGKSEDHELINGVHMADYIRRVDVPKSEFAFMLRGQQIRYLAVSPERTESIKTIELVKGPDGSAPIVMAITVQR